MRNKTATLVLSVALCLAVIVGGVALGLHKMLPMSGMWGGLCGLAWVVWYSRWRERSNRT